MSSIFSDLYEEINHRVIQIVLYKSLRVKPLEKDLCRSCKGERFVKTFCSNWRHEICMVFLCMQRYLARLNLEKGIFKAENETIYSTNDHLWHSQLCPRTENTLPLRKAKEAQVAVSREKSREKRMIIFHEKATFCFIIREFSIFLCCFLQ